MKRLALAALLALALTACGDGGPAAPPPTGPVSVEEDAGDRGLPRHSNWTEVEHPLGGTIWCLSGGYLDGAVLWCDPTTRTEQ